MRKIKMLCTYSLGDGTTFLVNRTYSESEMPKDTLDRFLRLKRGELIPEPRPVPVIEAHVDKPTENRALVVEEKKPEPETKLRKERSKSKRKRLVLGH